LNKEEILKNEVIKNNLKLIVKLVIFMFIKKISKKIIFELFDNIKKTLYLKSNQFDPFLSDR